MSHKKEPLFGPYVKEITYNTTILLLQITRLLSLIEKLILGPKNKENIYNVTIYYKEKTGHISLIEELILGPWIEKT